MSEIVDASTSPVEERSSPDNSTIYTKTRRSPRWHMIIDVCVILAMGAILFWGASSQFSNKYNDATRYQCYGIAFWQGKAALQAQGLYGNTHSQCTFLDTFSSSTLAEKMQVRHFPSFLVSLVQSQPTTEAFHALPAEYPLLTLSIFSLPLFATGLGYQVVFALLMLLTAGIIYLLIARYRSRPAAIVFAFYIAVGSWATAFGRFDLVPAGMALCALILAARAHWNWAYVLLALATLLKLYPAIFIPVFFIAQQKHIHGDWKMWQRWQGLVLFVALCTGVTLVSLLLNVGNTLYPINYFFSRPIQVESFPGTLLWLGKFVHYPAQYIFIYQSLNFTSPLAHRISLLTSFLLVVGLAYTFWLQWRSKLDIYTASLVTLLLVVILGKVFSPQYLIWITPFIAFAGKQNWKWVLSWGAVCALTTFVFPFNYVDIPHIDNVYPAIIARDVIILGITLALLFQATRKRYVLE